MTAPAPAPEPVSVSATATPPAASRNHLVVLAAAALKIGPKILPLFKVLKSGKFLLLFGSLAGYAWLWGPLFGAGFLALIAVHESGHVWAMKRAGIKTKGMYFLPFMGAVAVVDQNLTSRWQEYWLTIMGPVFGLGGVLVVLGAWYATGEPFLLALVMAGAFINLVNLLPILPLDGGRILRSVTLSAAGGNVGFVVVGLVTAGAAVFAWQVGFGLFAFFSLLGLWELYGDYRRTRAAREWREANPWLAHLADQGTLKDETGKPVEVPRILTPMSPARMAGGVLAALLLAAVLGLLWRFALAESGLQEIGEIFR